jgi:hypothetical protein
LKIIASDIWEKSFYSWQNDKIWENLQNFHEQYCRFQKNVVYLPQGINLL